MDLNAVPLPDDDDDTFERHLEDYRASGKHIEHVNHAEHVESAVDILRRVRHSLSPQSFSVIIPVVNMQGSEVRKVVIQRFRRHTFESYISFTRK